jgi:hypothetical protein
MLPKVASLANYGSALNNYSATVDSSTDRDAAGANPAYGDTAGMTHTATRAWARFVPAGSSAPSFATTNARDEVWNNGNNVAPTLARSSTGIYTLTYPATVFDEIPSTLPGATPAGFAVNLRAALCNVEPGSTTNYDARAIITAANVITVQIYTVGSSTLHDPNDGTTIGVFAV